MLSSNTAKIVHVLDGFKMSVSLHLTLVGGIVDFYLTIESRYRLQVSCCPSYLSYSMHLQAQTLFLADIISIIPIQQENIALPSKQNEYRPVTFAIVTIDMRILTM